MEGVERKGNYSRDTKATQPPVFINSGPPKLTTRRLLLREVSLLSRRERPGFGRQNGDEYRARIDNGTGQPRSTRYRLGAGGCSLMNTMRSET